jgi:hypothetical protein
MTYQEVETQAENLDVTIFVDDDDETEINLMPFKL